MSNHGQPRSLDFLSPSASSAPELPVVSLTKDGTLYLNKDMVQIDDLGKVIRQPFGSKVKAFYLPAKSINRPK
jgi:hypothetical protein